MLARVLPLAEQPSRICEWVTYGAADKPRLALLAWAFGIEDFSTVAVRA